MLLQQTIIILCVFALNSQAGNPVDNWKRNKLVDNCEFGLCENPEDYPEEAIKDLLTPELAAFFGNVISPMHDVPKDYDGTRSYQGTLCHSKSKIYHPKQSKHTKPHKFIINTGNFTQRIECEVCSDPKTTCFDSDVERVLPFETYCSQKYSYVNVVTLSEDRKSFEKTQISVPTSCTCNIKYNN